MAYIFSNTDHSVEQSDRKHSYRRFFATLGAAALLPLTMHALNPSVPPGSNFNMTYWELQLPIGSTGNPTTESSSALQNGYENFSYFFTESGDGAMVMKDPGVNCVTTPNSAHCRTELREVNPSNGQAASWDPNAATNRLQATVVVTNAGDETVIGQIHIDDSVSSKPVCELFYNSSGDISMGVEQTRSGGNEIRTSLGNVPVGTQFTYEIEYSGNVLKVAINGNFTTLSTYSLDAPRSYFKAGNYGQHPTASDVHFLALTIAH
jgi:Alginate lyase